MRKHTPADFGRFIREHKNGCWIWEGPKSIYGYGRFTINYKTYRAHRYSYELFRHKIPPRKCVLHRCDNRICVNPSHLFIGTYDDNNQDMKNKGRYAFGERHGRSKLSIKEVKEIRKLVKTGRYSYPEIASGYKVGRDNIGRIARFDTWRGLK